jgi:tetratricopeptide (TPR) repeat protein
VLAEENGWIKVKTRHGVSGWLDKDQAVHLNQAIAYLTKRIQVNPRDADAYHCRASAWLSLRDLEKAHSDLNDALRLDPRAAAYNNEGILGT